MADEQLLEGVDVFVQFPIDGANVEARSTRGEATSRHGRKELDAMT